MAEFYNPYQFIPVTGKINNQENHKIKYTALKTTHIRHDYWDQASYSGRMVCKITTKSPTVVGAKQTPGTDKLAGKVEPYKDIHNNIALPANSLRGMISSVAETLSQSSLRILNHSAYSYRKEYKDGLSAVGYLFKKNGDFYIKPLSLPSIDLQRGLLPKWKTVFSIEDSLIDWLPVYIDGYEKKLLDSKKTKTQQGYQQNSFLDRETPLSFFPKEGENKFYYAKLNSNLDRLSIEDINNHLGNQPNLKIKNGRSLLGQNLVAGSNNLINATAYDQLDEASRQAYTKGVLYVLGIDGRENDMPATKTHEKFLPYTDRKVLINLKIDKEVIDNFIAISKQRKEASKNQAEEKKLPFLPKGYKEEKESKNKNYWEPAHGELIYFDVDNKGHVSEISYSSIWRQKIQHNIYDAFANINKDLLPWGNEFRDPETSGLTPAECVFGVVAEKKTNKELKSYNLASRLKFSDAVSTEEIELMPERILKILASPKPPSPAMYFGAHNGYLKKSQLDLKKHSPNGRKVYLHHPSSTITNKLWETKDEKENLKQKLSCQVIPQDKIFYFHIDFNNLSWDELSLLAAAVDPGSAFLHRLGLGKPLGLGSVKAELCGLFLIDRSKRYQTLDNNRYSQNKFQQGWCNALKKLYPLEDQSIQDRIKTIDKNFETTLIDQQSLEALLVYGDQSFTQTSKVCYPFSHSSGQEPNQEGEGFQWHKKNNEVACGKELKIKSKLKSN